ncbi:hypothetical protein SmJEL517_g01577 [Synchytrium microbalum]|uniref:Bromo domain-containing protein n=1 Tax=Synchytrium microbalum TaxID=1806994 RepID=A0A507C9S3_9FUNG|nr:uncharacterized protein SmJEL517_g01577 [Synchytrium microbalum]TPX36352.1 hypothetical protein SmJEL517_g01577 [Synchytrium microbalum]
MHSFTIARQLLDSGGCKVYLTDEEFAVFQHVAANKQTWDAFWTAPKDTLKKMEPKANLLVHAEQVRGDYPHSARFYSVAALRIRAMISEQSLVNLVPIPDSVSALIVPNDINDLPKAWSSVDRDDRVNYGVLLPHVSNGISLVLFSPYAPILTFLLFTFMVDPHSLTIPIDDMYYTLEYNLEVMEGYEALKDRAVLEASIEEKVPVRNEPTPILRKAAPPPKAAPVVDVHDSIKYLHELIAKVVDEPKSQELQSLLHKVRPSKSKWASTERLGQEDLYEACEMVLNELKGYTDHSTPFMKPVSKKEAWNYYDIVKKPMDLGTMTKNLKNKLYLSKQDFSDDLYLIWSNCMLYNTWPESPFRKHASAMKRKSTELLRKVPNIVVKVIPGEEDYESEDDDDKDGSVADRSESNATGVPEVAGSRFLMTTSTAPEPTPQAETPAAQADTPAPMDMDDDTGVPGTPVSQGNVMDVDDGGADDGGTSPKASKAPVFGDAGNEDGGDGTEGGGETPRGSSLPPVEIDEPTEGDSESVQPLNPLARRSSSLAESIIKIEEPEVDIRVQPTKDDDSFRMMQATRADDDLVDDGGLQISHWKKATLEVRSHQWTERGRRLAMPVEDRKSLQPSADEVNASFEGDLLYLARNRHRRIGRADDEGNGPDIAYIPELSRVPIGIPCLRKLALNRVVDESAVKFYNLESTMQARQSQPHLSDYPNLQPPMSRLVTMFAQNKKDLRKVKQMASRIASRQSGASGTELPVPRKRRQRSTTESLPPINLDCGAAGFALRQIVSDLLIHAGFDSMFAFAVGGAFLLADVKRLWVVQYYLLQANTSVGAHMSAVSVLTDILITHFGNLGQSLRMYIDKYGRSMPSDEILLHTLEENGTSTDAMDSYIRNDILRYGDRLVGLQKKLETVYRRIDPDTGNAKYDEFDVEEWISGAVSDDIGADLLCLRELDVGVDVIPIDVWNRNAEHPLRPRRSESRFDSPRLPANAHILRSGKYESPEPWPIADPDEQIGLLSNFFSSRASQPDGLIDDEARQPPALSRGKLSLKLAQTVRRKPLETLVKKRPVAPISTVPNGAMINTTLSTPVSAEDSSSKKKRPDSEDVVVEADVKNKRARRPPKRVAE